MNSSEKVLFLFLLFPLYYAVNLNKFYPQNELEWPIASTKVTIVPITSQQYQIGNLTSTILFFVY